MKLSSCASTLLLAAVQVRRQGAGQVAVSYDYRDEDSALNHARPLRERLRQGDRFGEDLGV